MNIGRRDNYITATARTATGGDAYEQDPTSDNFGRLVSGGAVTTIQFWGDITDVRSNPDVGGGKRRDVRQIRIKCDSRDVADLTIDFTLTYDGSTDSFQVIDKFDSEFRFTTMVIAEYIK